MQHKQESLNKIKFSVNHRLLLSRLAKNPFPISKTAANEGVKMGFSKRKRGLFVPAPV
jgi:hypothetical protein